jgi:lipopolysaccharide biosynthesis protein
MNSTVRTIAYYLPQYHPIVENDEWWGKGFTEWTNVANAKPLFRGHYQPHVPADFGFYDLRVPETRIAQAELAREYGIEGFCYFHYWFAGKRLLERPFNEVLTSGKPDFPFCLCWANATWTGIWHGAPDRVLIEQTYPGMDDYHIHFEYLLSAFRDPRYIKVDGRPLFLIYRPEDLPEAGRVVELWKQMAKEKDLPGLYVVGVKHGDAWDPRLNGFDAAVLQKLPPKIKRIPWKYTLRKLDHMLKKCNLTVYDYREVMKTFIQKQKRDYVEFPCVIPNWDNTPRSGLNGLVLHNSTPELFRIHFREAMEKVKDKPSEQRFVFLKSWNEWAEGNHLEPDLRHGHAYLEVIREEINNSHY